MSDSSFTQGLVNLDPKVYMMQMKQSKTIN